MMGLLARAGAEITNDASDADVIVVNTCSFIESAQQESVNTILEMARHKTVGRAQKLVVAGCLVETPTATTSKKTFQKWTRWWERASWRRFCPLPGSQHHPPRSRAGRLSFSTAGRKAMRARRRGRFSRTEWEGAVRDLPNYLYDETTPRLLARPKHSAYIKIAEGAIILARFASFPSCVGSFGRGDLSPCLPRRNSS